MQAKELIPFLDLTSLNDSDSEDSLIPFFQQAKTPYCSVAAVCVDPRFVPLAKKEIQDKNIFIATVLNFPLANQKEKGIITALENTLQDGADEIDIVLYYQDYLSQGKSPASIHLLKLVKEICGQKKLKVILETGELQSAELIQKASEDAIFAGADFLKTSTGKTKHGASLLAAKKMLETIQKSGKSVGLKISGGVRTYEQALSYIDCIKKMKMEYILHPNTFRIGASSLLQNILELESTTQK